MFNSTNWLSKVPLLQRVDLLGNEHLFVSVFIALGIILWFGAKLKSNQLVQNMRRTQRQLDLLQQQQENSSATASSEMDDLQSNPVQREPASAPASPMEMARPQSRFAGLNPEQSVERRRRLRQQAFAEQLKK